MPSKCLTAVSAFALAAAVALGSGIAAPAPASAEAPYVVVDPGHGGSFTGAVGSGVVEKQVNLLIALELRHHLSDKGYRVDLTRYRDTNVTYRDAPSWHWEDDGPHFYADGDYTVSDDLQARCNVANRRGADLFVSIHNNDADSSSAHGSETYAASNDELGQTLSEYVQEEVVSAIGTADRGFKVEDFYVVRWTNMPAVLVEGGFVSNPSDAALLASPLWRARLAEGIAKGVARFLDSDPFAAAYPRFAGADRYGTAAAFSRAGWGSGTQTVLLACGETWPDALAAAPLSHKLDAPVLLTRASLLPTDTEKEIARLHPSRIVVLGGEGAVASAVVTEAVEASGEESVTVERLGGVDRYETAALVAERVGLSSDGKLAIASGVSFADALSLSPYAGSLGRPILLASTDATLPAATQAFIDAHLSEIHGVSVAGGSAVIRPEAVDSLPGMGRIAGADRYETSVMMARNWGDGTYVPVVASGVDFPDGLVAGAYGAKTGRPLLLLGRHVLPDRVRELIELDPDLTSGFVVAGGPGVIPFVMDAELQKAVETR